MSGRRGVAFAGIALLLGGLAGAAHAADAGIDYALHCRGCHLADGRGSPGAVPSLRGEVGKFLWVPRGREFLIRVPGSAQSPLSDARLAAVLNWMLHEFSPDEIPADFRPFAADEVARHRSPPLTDVESLRGDLVRAIDGARRSPPRETR